MMRFVKIALAIVLLLIAIFTAIGEGSLLINPPDAAFGQDFDSSGKLSVPWHEHARAVLFTSLCGCAAYLLVRRRTDPVAEIHCPRCMAVGGHKPASVYGGSVNPMALHFGGFLLSLIYSGSKKQRFHCRECAEPFYSHTAISRGYRLLFILFVALIAVWIVGESLEIMRGS
jgi:hypothetical protein